MTTQTFGINPLVQGNTVIEMIRSDKSRNEAGSITIHK